MTIVKEGKNRPKVYGEIFNGYELAAQFRKLGIEVSSQPLAQVEELMKFLGLANFSYGPVIDSLRMTIRGEDERLIEGVFSKGPNDNIFQFIKNGAASVQVEGVRSIAFGDSFGELGQCLLLKGGTILEVPVSIYIYEAAEMGVVPETSSSNFL